MPSSEYYRRQSETLLALAVNTNDPEVSTVCRNLAIEYKLMAEKVAADSALADPVTPSRSADEEEADCKEP
jgi:hypothetical protein